MKKLTILILTGLVSISLINSLAFAGSKQRHRWQGVAIGVGTAILGTMIYNELQNNHTSIGSEKIIQHKTTVYHNNRSCCSGGHWEINEIWISATYRKIWKAGHYSHRKGRWVPGRWKKHIDIPGHWEEKRMWVGHSNNCRRNRHYGRKNRPQWNKHNERNNRNRWHKKSYSEY